MRGLLKDQGLAFDVGPRDHERLGWYVLEDLPGSHRYAALGSIHAKAATQFSDCFVKDPSIMGNRRVIVASMIRHPVTRTESFLAAWPTDPGHSTPSSGGKPGPTGNAKNSGPAAAIASLSLRM